jgi:hypothetical protein
MKRDDFPAPSEGFTVAHFLPVTDETRSTHFYTNVLVIVIPRLSRLHFNPIPQQ